MSLEISTLREHAYQQFLDQLAFPADTFQAEAMQHIAAGHNVVVCAPTGSGKTLIAEYAAHQALAERVKLFYTTPLKALSNQKFRDFQKQFGANNVGLLTGDTAINRDASLVVMTTEIFRNMLYGLHQQEGSILDEVGYVVLDECHFMNDAERGTVWEESIIYCPPSIQMIALSATVANAQELADWIHTIHDVTETSSHRTELIQTDYRPVPLRFYYDTREELLPLFEGPERLNRKLKTDVKGNRFRKPLRQFTPNVLLEALYERDMLPAIVFTFSRKDCDKYLRETQPLRILTPAERQLLQEKIKTFLEQNPFLNNHWALPYLHNGFASHHAGLLPALKLLVETLFQQGLIKAVFATETLAAGINMPARTTVITTISKRDDNGHRLLHASEFLQMSGRAGRRGMDTVGHVVIVKSQFYSAQDVARLASSQADPLNSQFTPTYGMVVNLLQRHTLEQAQTLLSKSFAQFTAARRLQPLKAEIDQHVGQLNEYMEFTCPEDVSEQGFQQFLKSRTMAAETAEWLRTLKQQLKKYGPAADLNQELSKAQAKQDNLLKTVTESPCYACKLLSKHRSLEDKIQRQQKRLKFLNRLLQEEEGRYWQRFLNIYALLHTHHYLAHRESGPDLPTRKGELLSAFRHENEFQLVEVMDSDLLNDLPPEGLAAVLCAFVNDSNKENVFAKIWPSGQVRQAFERIQKQLRQLEKQQEKHHVDVRLVFNPVASGLIEAWAQGKAWDQLVGATSLDEGDLVRLFRRTADLLRQMGRAHGLPDGLAQTARLAAQQIDRDPIAEGPSAL